MIIPEVGTSGYFNLAEPFNTLSLTFERYTVKAVRKLSDYLSNNEKPLDDIYKLAGLVQADYDADIAVDMAIVVLQSAKGHILSVPARYVLSYPIADGTIYRVSALSVMLPAMPIEKSYDLIKDEVRELIKDTLGVSCKVEVVEVSRPVMVPKEKHDIEMQKRAQFTMGKGSTRLKLNSLRIQNQLLLDKVAELEAWIIANKP